MYRPKDAERLVLYLKDINLPKPDKWGTSMLIAFLQQVGVHTIINLISVCTKDWDQRYVSPLNHVFYSCYIGEETKVVKM